jgi:hypothetical protein
MIVETSKGKLPVRFGMAALAKYGDLTGRTMNEVMKSLQDLGKLKISELLALLYVGFVDGARFAGEECAVSSTDEVADMVDKDGELINKMISAFEGDGEDEVKDTKKK